MKIAKMMALALSRRLLALLAFAKVVSVTALDEQNRKKLLLRTACLAI